MASISNSAYPMRTKDACFRVIDNEAVILNLHNSVYYSLNEVGARIWELCDGQHSISGIAGIICQEFEVEEEEVQRDIRELITDLEAEKLVEIHEHTSTSPANQKS